MTDKTIDRDANGQPSKMPGWFSWRHQTNEAHIEARMAYQARAARRPKQHWDEGRNEWVKDGDR